MLNLNSVAPPSLKLLCLCVLFSTPLELCTISICQISVVNIFCIRCIRRHQVCLSERLKRGNASSLNVVSLSHCIVDIIIQFSIHFVLHENRVQGWTFDRMLNNRMGCNWARVSLLCLFLLNVCFAFSSFFDTDSWLTRTVQDYLDPCMGWTSFPYWQDSEPSYLNLNWPNHWAFFHLWLLFTCTNALLIQPEHEYSSIYCSETVGCVWGSGPRSCVWCHWSWIFISLPNALKQRQI